MFVQEKRCLQKTLRLRLLRSARWLYWWKPFESRKTIAFGWQERLELTAQASPV